MDAFSRFAGDVGSPYWWLSVVCVGLLINLASSYMKEPLDRWIGRRFESARIRSEHRRNERDLWIDLLSKDSRLLALEMQAELRHGVSIAIASVCFVLIQVLSIANKSGVSTVPGYEIIILFSTFASLLFLVRSIRGCHVHYMNVELAKRLILRSRDA